MPHIIGLHFSFYNVPDNLLLFSIRYPIGIDALIFDTNSIASGDSQNIVHYFIFVAKAFTKSRSIINFIHIFCDLHHLEINAKHVFTNQPTRAVFRLIPGFQNLLITNIFYEWKFEYYCYLLAHA